MMPRAIAVQRGAALVVSLVMLALITILVITALNLGAANFRAVTNTQFRDEAIAAANLAIQSRISSTFTDLPVTTEDLVDINFDGTTDYEVQVTPTCISASIAETADPSSAGLPPSMSLASTWNTVWDIAAAVTDDTTGASVVVHAGTRVLLGQSDRDRACP
jgi:type II secretory pathway pseudopilin PulG